MTRRTLEDVPSLENAQRPSRRNPLRRFCLGAVVGAILLAIALGAGLGVGLKKKSSNAHPSLASMSSDGSDRNVQVPPASNFVLRGQQALAQEPATTRYYDFVLEQRYGAPDGFNKTMLVVNGGFTRAFAGEWRPRRTQIPLPAGMYPGPTIEVNSDDRIVVNVTNLMPNATAVRIHAFRADRLRSRDSPSAFRLDPLARTVPARYVLLRRYKWSHPGGHKPTPPNRAFAAESLVAQCGIPPGSSLVYNFTLDGWVGSTWWHAHMSTQYTDGLSGAFIVHNRTEKLVAQVDGELSIQLSDLYHRFSDDLLVQYLSRAGMTGEGLAGVTQGNETNRFRTPARSTASGAGAASTRLSPTIPSSRTRRIASGSSTRARSQRRASRSTTTPSPSSKRTASSSSRLRSRASTSTSRSDTRYCSRRIRPLERTGCATRSRKMRSRIRSSLGITTSSASCGTASTMQRCLRHPSRETVARSTRCRLSTSASSFRRTRKTRLLRTSQFLFRLRSLSGSATKLTLSSIPRFYTFSLSMQNTANNNVSPRRAAPFRF